MAPAEPLLPSVGNRKAYISSTGLGMPAVPRRRANASADGGSASSFPSASCSLACWASWAFAAGNT